MKALKNILLVLVLVVLGVSHAYAQYSDPLPTTGFSSTSSGAFASGSSYSSAAVTGVMSADDYYNSMSPSRSSIRRSRGDDEGIIDPSVEDPTEVDTPIGEGLWVLLLLVGIYSLYSIYSRYRNYRDYSSYSNNSNNSNYKK